MALKYNNAQHREYMALMHRVSANWLQVFQGNTLFYSAAYWDLLTHLWEADAPVRKTDTLGFMTAVKSPHTAGKYVDTALAEGLVVETDNPEDARSKLVALSPAARAALDAFFDSALAELRQAERNLHGKGPLPEEP